MVSAEILNSSGVIASILAGGTQNLTGSLALTLLVIILILFTFCLMFNIPFEFILVLLMPLVIVSAGISTTYFVGMLAVFILFLGFIITKNFLFRG